MCPRGYGRMRVSQFLLLVSITWGMVLLPDRAPRIGMFDREYTEYPQSEKPASPCNGSMGVMLRLRMAMQGGYSRVPAQ